MPAALAIFDLDGTLVDSQHMIVAGMTAAYLAEGQSAPSPEAIRRIIPLTLERAVTVLSPDLPPPLIGRIVAGYRTNFGRLAAAPQPAAPLFEGAKETLQRLKQAGYLLAIATGKGRRGLDQVLAMHDLAEHFVSLQTADRAAGKPHPEMVLNAMAEAGAAPEETLVIGDTTYDIHMARAAQVRPLAVAWGYHPLSELMAAGAVEGFETFGTLGDHLLAAKEQAELSRC